VFNTCFNHDFSDSPVRHYADAYFGLSHHSIYLIRLLEISNLNFYKGISKVSTIGLGRGLAYLDVIHLALIPSIPQRVLAASLLIFLQLPT
jgi:hypothetical protein